MSPLSEAAGGGGFDTPLPGTSVELLREAGWQNGWVVQNASNPHAVTVAKTGQSNYLIRNLRWDIDVRPCSSPFASRAPVNQQPEEEEGQSLSPPGRSLPQPEDQDQANSPATTFDF